MENTTIKYCEFLMESEIQSRNLKIKRRERSDLAIACYLNIFFNGMNDAAAVSAALNEHEKQIEKGKE